MKNEFPWTILHFGAIIVLFKQAIASHFNLRRNKAWFSNSFCLLILEQLRLQDMEIQRALKMKQELVADILHVPQDEFRTIADIAGEPGANKEASELLLAAISQGTKLNYSTAYLVHT